MAWKNSYNYCRICGHTPGKDEEPNRAPIQFWEPDDGWVIGTLCRPCHEEFGGAQPKPGDFAYDLYYGEGAEGGGDISIETDEDPFLALM